MVASACWSVAAAHAQQAQPEPAPAAETTADTQAAGRGLPRSETSGLPPPEVVAGLVVSLGAAGLVDHQQIRPPQPCLLRQGEPVIARPEVEIYNCKYQNAPGTRFVGGTADTSKVKVHNNTVLS